MDPTQWNMCQPGTSRQNDLDVGTAEMRGDGIPRLLVTRKLLSESGTAQHDEVLRENEDLKTNLGLLIAEIKEIKQWVDEIAREKTEVEKELLKENNRALELSKESKRYKIIICFLAALALILSITVFNHCVSMNQMHQEFQAERELWKQQYQKLLASQPQDKGWYGTLKDFGKQVVIGAGLNWLTGGTFPAISVAFGAGLSCGNAPKLLN